MYEIIKNRDRSKYSFANINLLGKCNANCFFCLGKDIDNLLSEFDQTKVHFNEWEDFEQFLNKCKQESITKLYITGLNTDPLLYRYLDELIDYLHECNFTVGIRTNGYLSIAKMKTINKCTNSVGYSIHTLNKDTQLKIMGRGDIPDWDNILKETKNPRVSIVITKYNKNEFYKIIEFLSQFENVKYIQVRKISTETRLRELLPHIKAYEKLFEKNKKEHLQIGEFNLAERYTIKNKEITFWRTIETKINSINYFTNGKISDEYFVVEGYLKNKGKKND